MKESREGWPRFLFPSDSQASQLLCRVLEKPDLSVDQGRANPKTTTQGCTTGMEGEEIRGEGRGGEKRKQERNRREEDKTAGKNREDIIEKKINGINYIFTVAFFN